MEIRVLGTAAGGGFPQWNCHCEGCAAARSGAAPARLQSSIAVSADGENWALINASPDVAAQIVRFLPQSDAAAGVRHSPVGEVWLTNADLDHCLGLFALREADRMTIRAPDGVRRSLIQGMNLHHVLEPFTTLDWAFAPTDWEALPMGLELRAVPLAGAEPPRFHEPGAVRAALDHECHGVGYLVRERAGAPVAGFFPDVARIDDSLTEELRGCTHLWFDGTFWSEDEMAKRTGSERTARQMGHWPIGGSGGSLEILSALDGTAVSYLHVNNTNPILIPGSPERAELERAGARVADDGERISL